MMALIDESNFGKKLVDNVKNPRTFLNDLYQKNTAYQVYFYKRIYGSTTEVAHVTFTHPYTVTIRFARLTITQQKQFIGFVTDHLSNDVYQQPYSIEMVE